MGQVLRLRLDVGKEDRGGQVADRRIIKQVRVFRAWRQDPRSAKGSRGHQRGKEWASKRRYSEAVGVWENIFCPDLRCCRQSPSPGYAQCMSFLATMSSL